MINIVLFQEDSMIRIVKKTAAYFSSNSGLRISGNTLWLDGGYIKFSRDLVTINQIKQGAYDVREYLTKVLFNEEVFISEDDRHRSYYSPAFTAPPFDICSEASNGDI